MKSLTTHHDGHGLTEDIKVEAVGEVGPGGAYHRYEFWNKEDYVGFLQFQEGPRNEEGSTPGVLSVAVLAVLEDISDAFQHGPYPSDENEEALYHIREAMNSLKKRADNRARRGVLGFNTI